MSSKQRRLNFLNFKLVKPVKRFTIPTAIGTPIKQITNLVRSLKSVVRSLIQSFSPSILV